MGQIPELVEQLLAARAYPHPVGTVELIETHISWVLLTGRYAYKIKKPVDLGFLDFSTLKKRRAACELELSLNRRLAKQLYMGVVPIADTPGGPRLGGAGAAIEYAVKMHQFEPGNTLDHLIATAALEPAMFERFATGLAEFHASLPAAAHNTAYGAAWKVASAAQDNLGQLARTSFGQANAEEIERLRKWSAARSRQLAGFFDQRKAGGFIRECHGDLHLGNLVAIGSDCLAFDCLEFSADLRWMDVLDEVAFLVMDLLAHQRQDLAFTFLNRYLETNGDYQGLQALRFYLVYRALVRSKVWALTAQPTSASGSSEPEARAGAYLDLAQRIAAGSWPRLLLTHGLSGSGKSWLSQRLAARLPAVRIRSDVERKRMLNLPATARTGAQPNEGPYSASTTRRVYELCLRLADAPVADGWPVIIDAAALKAWQRAAAAGKAAEMGVPFCLLSCEADASVVEKRVSDRQQRAAEVSEADLAVLRHQLANAEPVADTEAATLVRIRTDQKIDWPILIKRIEETSR